MKMAFVFRQAAKKFGFEFLKNEKSGLLSFVRPATTKAKSATGTKEEGYDERNMKLKRPQSPHLTIYAPQLTSMLSISQRISGMTLSAYAISLGLGAVALPDTIPNYIDELECLEVGTPLITAMKFVLIFPLCYHFWNGIRHLLWDMGQFLSIRLVYITGYLMLLLTISSAVALAII